MTPDHVIETGDYVESREGRQILVADDDPDIVRLLEEKLTELGHEVLCAYDGQMAVRLARQYHPQLAILNVHMPMTSGLKAFEFLRANAETAQIPVIFFTGEQYSDVHLPIAGAARVAHIKKPFDLDSLKSLVTLFLSQYSVA